MRREGDASKAADIMENEIAPLLAEWTEKASCAPNERRQRVESMLAEEMRRVEDACFLESRLNERLTDRLQNIISECTSQAAQQIRSDQTENLHPSARRIVKDLAAKWKENSQQIAEELKEEIRQSAARPVEDYARLTAPIQQQLRSLREALDLDSQALHERHAQEVRGSLDRLLNRDQLLGPLREEVHGFLNEIREEWRLVRETQEPSLRNLLTPLQKEFRELTEDIGAQMMQEQREQKTEIEKAIAELRGEINEFRELPAKAIKANAESLRQDMDTLLGNPRRDMRKMLEPIREDLSILRQESRGKVLREEWGELRKLVEEALSSRREDVRELLKPLTERMEEIAESPQGELRAQRETLAEILDMLREMPGHEMKDRLKTMSEDLDRLVSMPLKEFRELSQLLRKNLASNHEYTFAKLFEEMRSLRADMETLWLNPSEDTAAVVKPLKDSLRTFEKEHGREAMEKLIQPVAADIENLRKRMNDLCQMIHYGTDEWKDRQKKRQVEIEKANQAAARPQSLKESRRDLLRAVISENAPRKATPKVPVWDIPAVIDAILSEQKGDAA